MFKIIEKRKLTDKIWLMVVDAARIARKCCPGQFLIVRIDEFGERIPLTISDYDKDAGTVTIVFQEVGASTTRMKELNAGDGFADIAGPLGQPGEITKFSDDELKNKKFLFVAGGVGTAPVYPQVKWLHEKGIDADVIIGAKTRELVILEDEMRSVAADLIVATDDGSYGVNGNVTVAMRQLIEKENRHYDMCIAIGPLVMMKFASLTTKEFNIPTVVSMNPIMVDGTGMCGACRLLIGDEVKFACVDGPEFDGHKVDFDAAMKRQQQYKTEEGRAMLKLLEGETHHGGCGMCGDDTDGNAGGDNICAKRGEEGSDNICAERDVNKKVPVREQAPDVRNKNFKEVCLGYSEEEAVLEAGRCLNCKNPKCVSGCPVNINIPKFIEKIKERKFTDAADVIADASSLPAICGRVCPQESQCEGVCIRGIKGEAVSIGKLERFVSDYAREHNYVSLKKAEPKGKKVAVIGSGPSGLTCAGELAKMGYEVKIFEALHEPGGVLTYGIPEFRLPKQTVVRHEVENVKALGVEIETDVIVGKSVTVDELFANEGYSAVYIASGAGLPMFMNIPGETLNGVFSANEFLTRNNLMKAFAEGYDTPIRRGEKVCVVGGGNVAMDAARTALRLGAQVHIVYRRSEAELPARAEEVMHAKEEGVIFDLLQNPVEILGDENGNVKGMRVIRMELGEPDASGRRRPVELAGSEYEIECDTVIMSLGTTPNPLIAGTTEGLTTGRKGVIETDEFSGATSREGVFCGGDAATGAATVILAMEAGKKAARGIHEYLSE